MRWRKADGQRAQTMCDIWATPRWEAEGRVWWFDEHTKDMERVDGRDNRPLARGCLRPN